MKIVLVHPAGSNWIPGQKDISTVVNRMAPVGLLSLASFLRKNGYDTAVYDCLGPHCEEKDHDHVRSILEEFPDVAGFSATTSSFPNAARLCTAVKAQRPDIITVVGGVHATAYGEKLLESYDSIDLLVTGEGERPLVDLAQGKAYCDISGLVYRDGERVLSNAPGGLIQDLDTLPFPAYDMLEGFPRKYFLPMFSSPGSPGATMITSRGCPYGCSYCDRSVFGRKFRFNSAQYVYEHMLLLSKDYGVRHINIYDDLFTLDRDRIVQLCEMLIEKPLGVTFNCAVRVGHADGEILSLLKNAGAWMISLGIESGDQELLNRYKPGMNLTEVRDTVSAIRNAGLKVKGLFMAGLPGETSETLAATSDFIISLGLDDMNLSKFTPFAGAPLWEELKDDERFEEDWEKMNCLNFVYVSDGFESREDLELCYASAVKRFYTDPGWRKRFWGRAWQCRHSFGLFLRHLPAFLKARRHFDPECISS